MLKIKCCSARSISCSDRLIESASAVFTPALFTTRKVAPAIPGKVDAALCWLVIDLISALFGKTQLLRMTFSLLWNTRRLCTELLIMSIRFIAAPHKESFMGPSALSDAPRTAA